MGQGRFEIGFLRVNAIQRWWIKAKILLEFCNKMMISGYSEKFRLEVIKSAVRGYEKQCLDADQGIKPLHRSREFQAEQR